MTKERTRLAVPRLTPVVLAKNFIRTAVCELRFPALLTLDNALVGKFQTPLRSQYPLFERQRSVSISLSEGEEEVERESAFLFRSKDRHWTISLKNAALSLETDQYTAFEDLEARLKKIVSAAIPIIDADFFTRVGLRYVNAVPLTDRRLSDVINRSLVAPLDDRLFGTVSKYVQEVRGLTDTGSYTLRHGFAEEIKQIPGEHYLLDIDLYSEDVKASELMTMLQSFRIESFSLFMWCLAEKQRAELLSSSEVSR